MDIQSYFLADAVTNRNTVDESLNLKAVVSNVIGCFGEVYLSEYMFPFKDDVGHICAVSIVYFLYGRVLFGGTVIGPKDVCS